MSKQKRAKCAGSTRDDFNKLRCISASQGMFKMAESMDNVAKAMAPLSPPSESKPGYSTLKQKLLRTRQRCSVA